MDTIEESADKMTALTNKYANTEPNEFSQAAFKRDLDNILNTMDPKLREQMRKDANNKNDS